MSATTEPCGGCGEADAKKACIGCLHFAALSPEAPAREGVSGADMLTMTCFANNHDNPKAWAAWSRIRAALTPRHEAPASEGERFTAEQAWADLLEKADRNSPEDSPMLLITWEEMADYMDRAQSDACHEAPAEGAGEDAAWMWLNGHVECDPADRDYSADEMVDAFMAGQSAALRARSSAPEAREDAPSLAEALMKAFEEVHDGGLLYVARLADNGRMVLDGDFDLNDIAARVAAAVRPQPTLTVWYGSMPESNGRQNWTAILTRKDAEGFDIHSDGFCFHRSEYPDRARYEADEMRWIIGELAERPDILAYDETKHSGYVAPKAPPVAHLRDAHEGQGDECLVPAAEGDPGSFPVYRRTPDRIVAFQRRSPTSGWVTVEEDDVPHYRSRGQEIRALGVVA